MKSKSGPTTPRVITPHTPPSLPPALLHSTHNPTPDQQQMLRSNLTELRSSLHDIQSKMQALETELAELRSVEADLIKGVQLNESARAPIRGLPAELVEEIFGWVGAGSGGVKWGGDGGDSISREMPWRLGRVCSFWRTVYLTLPVLWSEFHIDLRAVATNCQFDAAHELLKVCLARSGTEMLRFSIKADGIPDLVRPLLETLVEHSQRWMEAELALKPFGVHCPTLRLAHGALPNLQKLVLSTGCIAADNDTDLIPLDEYPTLEAFEIAPRLTHLKLIRLTHPFHSIRVPWAQITDLTTQFNTFRQGEFSLILRNASSLLSLSTQDERVLEMTTTANTTPSLITLPHLTHLSLQTKGSYINKTLQLLTLPSLTHLRISARTLFNAPDVVSMVKRSSCVRQLQMLDVETSGNGREDVVWEENAGVLHLIGEVGGWVKEVRIKVVDAAKYLVARLLVGRQGMAGAPQGVMVGGAYGYGHGHHQNAGSKVTLLPRMQKLVLEDPRCVSAAEIVEMVLSRMAPSSSSVDSDEDSDDEEHPLKTTPLSQVRLRLTPPCPPQFRELDVLRKVATERGLDVDVVVG